MPLFLCFFFLSGFAGLIYESLWTRDLTHVIGGSPYAVSVILTVFMAGLGGGGYLGGILADRLKSASRLLAAYGVCEMGIGLYAVALPFLLSFAEPAFSLAYRSSYSAPLAYHVMVFLLAAVVLLPPILAMGATLPLIVRFWTRGPKSLAGSVGLLYGLNTFGAACGVLAAGLWLLPSIGLRAASLTAAAINAAIGAVSLFLSSRMSAAVEADSAHGSAAEAAARSMRVAVSDPMGNTKVTAGGFRKACLVFAVSGFCAMAYEVAWTKILGLVMGPTTYAFTLVLAVFIIGLAIGGWVSGWFVDRIRNPAVTLGSVQAMAALSALAAAQRMGNGLYLFQKIELAFEGRFEAALAGKALFLGLFMIVPTLLLGASFPIVMRMAGDAKPRMGRAIGTAYAWNTMGGVMGAWAAGFILIPRLVSERTLALLAAVQAVVAALAAFSSRSAGKGFASRPVALVPAALALACCIAYPRWDRESLSRAATPPNPEILSATGWMGALMNRVPRPQPVIPSFQRYYGDGIGGFTSVWETRELVGGSSFGLYVSGKADASSKLDMFTQVLLAQFPMALHPRPRKVMVLGLASGVTAGEVLAYPVERLDVLEINPQVAEASAFFRPWNGDVLRDPRTHLIVQDAKAHLLLSRERYDVIISEPSNPWMAGLAELYSREFFERARDRLEDGGILVEFLHSYQMDWDVFSLIGRTFAGVFPNGMLVRAMPDDRRLPGSASDYLLIGIKGDAMPRFEPSDEKRSALGRSRNLRLEDPRLFYRLVETEDLPRLFGSGPITTDDHPVLEFRAPRLRFTMDSRPIEAAIAAGSELTAATRAARDSLGRDSSARLGFAEYALSVWKPFPGMLDGVPSDSVSEARLARALDAYCENVHVTDWDFLTEAAARTRCSVHQMAALNRSLKEGGSSAVLLAMGEVCMVNGMADNALKYYGRALESAGETSAIGAEAARRMEEIRRFRPQ
jgi:spermidine synthase